MLMLSMAFFDVASSFLYMEAAKAKT